MGQTYLESDLSNNSIKLIQLINIIPKKLYRRNKKSYLIVFEKIAKK